ncbi:TetR/AcrR family transcriptional regulator [Lentilactobacillus senioris]|uniref:TetR/AcrR family transcriptional regulator n=1 Tax=Lentilactobacillus senioris TaxID=931534 RepID=UPI0022828A66|nr:TetR/AcrR family transcriptional regulator [Lentilactobacillus senioris]MCY9806189.1 TetR/AcrR family transcriptional regulator [Lentilactobacillus senioris]
MTPTPLRDLFQNNLQGDQELPAKQKQVLKAALDLFAAQGFENTTTKQIATLANVSEGTVYKRFKTKDQLLTAVLKPIINDVTPQMASEFKQVLTKRQFDSISDLIITIGQDRLQFVFDNQKELRILLGEILKKTERVKEFSQLLTTSIIPAVYNQFDQLKAHHKLVDWDNERIFQYIVSIILSYVTQIVMFSAQLDLTQILSDTAEFFERGLAPIE